jgi:hypothetical protein
MSYDHELNQYAFFPTWLPLHQREQFRDRALKAFARATAIHGPVRLTDTQARRRIIGGLAAAFRTGRVGATEWGRSMLAKRGGKANVRAAAMRGKQCRAYFGELGRKGVARREENRRRKRWGPEPSLPLPPSQRRDGLSAKNWMSL